MNYSASMVLPIPVSLPSTKWSKRLFELSPEQEYPQTLESLEIPVSLILWVSSFSLMCWRSHTFPNSHIASWLTEALSNPGWQIEGTYLWGPTCQRIWLICFSLLLLFLLAFLFRSPRHSTVIKVTGLLEESWVTSYSVYWF